MDQRTIQILFTLLRSAICGMKLTEEERTNYSSDLLPDLLKISSKHDVDHLLVLGLKQNELISKENADIEKCILKAVYRYERIRYELENLYAELEKAQIPFLPLKGSVLRKYYPEAWMRTSCDIDVFVHEKDSEKAKSVLVKDYGYVYQGKGSHDISLFSPDEVHIELHYDLVEDGFANAAPTVLERVWDTAVVKDGFAYCYRMPDEMFYFYHIAHMAKHFENGGCGIRPFIDLWLLDNIEGADTYKRDEVLADGGLLQFANVSRKLSRIWFGGEKSDKLSLQMQNFILRGGVYGSADNRVALQQKKKGGRMGYILSRVFIPYAKLKRYYPILEKHRWLTPFMQVRRWFMLLRPDVARMAKREMEVNRNIETSKTDEMNNFLGNIGL